jgi:hypothetical protein
VRNTIEVQSSITKNVPLATIFILQNVTNFNYIHLNRIIKRVVQITLNNNLHPILNPELHPPIPADHHLIDNRKPELFVKLRQHRRSLLYVADETIQDLSPAYPLSLGGF